ncbi:unnamed protein product [Rotaria magnacalcarata]|uniref:Uncharacterized protein n=1 Tax=Rotaria magnacalcarata TaxID=392030 RepID=A0A819MW34_9BILA|nr:unnamed protein product [Rotaria magnacalcarata]CAF3984698.1 unnamed protein product [Rotaria magnacalcarata]
MNNLNYLLDLLKQQQQKKIMESSYIEAYPSLSFDFINKHSLLKSGKLTYEFIRLNLPESLRSVTMLNTLILNSNAKISEAAFRFDQLQKHFGDHNLHYAFGSEDATSIINRIKYDSTTNTFNGFPRPLGRGVLIKEYYRTDSFDKLKLWLD